MRLFAAFAGLALVFFGAGCIQEDTEGKVLVFEYTLRSLSGSEEGRYASAGAHCGTAFVDHDEVRVARGAWEDMGSPDAFLVVDTSLDGDWHTTGGEPVAMAYPASVIQHVGDGNETVAHIDWRATEDGQGEAWVDGKRVDLPAPSRYLSTDGTWEAEGTLRWGPEAITTFEAGLCA